MYKQSCKLWCGRLRTRHCHIANRGPIAEAAVLQAVCKMERSSSRKWFGADSTCSSRNKIYNPAEYPRWRLMRRLYTTDIMCGTQLAEASVAFRCLFPLSRMMRRGPGSFFVSQWAFLFQTCKHNSFVPVEVFFFCYPTAVEKLGNPGVLAKISRSEAVRLKPSFQKGLIHRPSDRRERQHRRLRKPESPAIQPEEETSPLVRVHVKTATAPD
jgi:hypothetical protein